MFGMNQPFVPDISLTLYPHRKETIRDDKKGNINIIVRKERKN